MNQTQHTDAPEQQRVTEAVKFQWHCDDCRKGGVATIRLPVQVRDLHHQLEQSHQTVHPHSACPSDYFEVHALAASQPASAAPDTDLGRETLNPQSGVAREETIYTDTERLNWLEQQDQALSEISDAKGLFCVLSKNWGPNYGKSFREAIDNAMRREQEEA